jgi:hypothetical protein
MANFIFLNLKNPFVGFTNLFFWSLGGKNSPQKKNLVAYLYLFVTLCHQPWQQGITIVPKMQSLIPYCIVSTTNKFPLLAFNGFLV